MQDIGDSDSDLDPPEPSPSRKKSKAPSSFFDDQAVEEDERSYTAEERAAEELDAAARDLIQAQDRRRQEAGRMGENMTAEEIAADIQSRHKAAAEARGKSSASQMKVKGKERVLGLRRLCVFAASPLSL